MRRTEMALLSFVLIATGCATSPPSGGDAERLVALNRHLFERLMLHHDTAPYERTALPEYLFVANIGIIENKQAVVSNPENLAIERVTITNEELRIRDNNTAVLVGTMDVRGTVLGYPLPELMRYMSVFVRTGGEWMLLSQSLTPVNDPREAGPPPE